MNGDLLTVRDVLALTGLHRTTLDLHRSGKGKTPFPPPAARFGQSPVWNRADVEAWMRQPRKRGRAPRAALRKVRAVRAEGGRMMLDATTIKPGQRYAVKVGTNPWTVSQRHHQAGSALKAGRQDAGRIAHPIVEPERLHEIPIGSTVLNVATGERHEWDEEDVSAAEMPCPYWMPLLALVATPEEDT